MKFIVRSLEESTSPLLDFKGFKLLSSSLKQLSSQEHLFLAHLEGF